MDFSDIIAYIESVAQSLSDWVISVVSAIYDVLAAAINYVWSALLALASSLGDIFSTISDWLDDLWWEYIIPFVEWAQQIIDDITTWLANFLDPLITFVQAVLKWYQTYIRPILTDIQEILSVARVMLSILKLLGVKWAAKLDADLQLVQSWVTLVMKDITGTLNTISTVLGVMVDPTGILRMDFLPQSLFSSLGAVKRAAGYGADRPSLPGELTQTANNNALVIGDAPMGTINADGTVTYQPAMAPIRSDVDAGYAAIGVQIYAS